MTPSIKEALELAIKFIESHMHYSQPAPDMGEEPSDTFTNEALPVVVGLNIALATFQPDGERREAIAQTLAGKWPGDYMQGDDECEREPNALAYETADVVLGSLASGLVQDEAGILKAMEQECWTLRCVDIPTGGGDADVGWEVIQHHQAKPYERMIAHGRTPQEALNAAIRSARNGGAET